MMIMMMTIFLVVDVVIGVRKEEFGHLLMDIVVLIWY
jgi:hypothetical protein